MHTASGVWMWDGTQRRMEPPPPRILDTPPKCTRPVRLFRGGGGDARSSTDAPGPSFRPLQVVLDPEDSTDCG